MNEEAQESMDKIREENRKAFERMANEDGEGAWYE